MTVYVVLSKIDYGEINVEEVFTNRKTAEDYMLTEAVKEMDYFNVPCDKRRCVYDGKELTQIYEEDEYYTDWWIVARALKEE